MADDDRTAAPGEDGFDPARELCPDPSCIGVLGTDGRCKACGAGSGVPRPAGDPFDVEHRELCPDGACVGVLGPGGLCKECGTPGRTATLDPRQRGLLTEDELRERTPPPAPAPAPAPLAAPDVDGFDDRELCPDGACIGVLGVDGRCRECGRAADEA